MNTIRRDKYKVKIQIVYPHHLKQFLGRYIPAPLRLSKKVPIDAVFTGKGTPHRRNKSRHTVPVRFHP